MRRARIECMPPRAMARRFYARSTRATTSRPARRPGASADDTTEDFAGPRRPKRKVGLNSKRMFFTFGLKKKKKKKYVAIINNNNNNSESRIIIMFSSRWSYGYAIARVSCARTEGTEPGLESRFPPLHARRRRRRPEFARRDNSCRTPVTTESLRGRGAIGGISGSGALSPARDHFLFRAANTTKPTGRGVQRSVVGQYRSVFN